MSCATDDILAAWAAGQVGGTERDSLDEHAAGCALCRGVMLGLAGVTRTAARTVRAEDPATSVIPATDQRIREAELLAKLQHPTLAKVLSLEVSNDELRVRSEIIDGTPLDEWMTRPRPPAARTKVLAMVGRGLNVLHAHRITHGAVTQQNILVRRDGTGVIINPAFGSTPRDDQAAWWRVVAETMGRPRRLRAAVAKGTSEDPNKRFGSMELAVMSMRNRVGDRAWLKWGVLVFVGVIAISVITTLTGSSNQLQRFGKESEKCAVTATREWRAMRAPVIVKLAAAGVNTHRVIAALDERTLTTANLQRDTCKNGHPLAERACVDSVWGELTSFYPDLIDPSPEVVRGAVDDLRFLTPPNRCMEADPPRSHSPRAASIQTKIHNIQLQELPARDEVKELLKLETEVTTLGDDSTSAVFHLAIGMASVRAQNSPVATSELVLAVDDAQRAGDHETLERALMAQVRISTRIDAELERRAEAAAAQAGNPGLTAQLAHDEGILHAKFGDPAGALSNLRAAKRELEAIAIDTDPTLINTDWWLGNAIRDSGEPADARPIYDQALELSRKRWGDEAHITLRIRATRANNEVTRGNYDFARVELTRVASSFERLYELGNEDVVNSRGALCECDLAAKATTRSCDGVLAAAVAAYGQNDIRLSLSLDRVARQRLLSDHADEAVTLLERALKLENPDDQSAIEADLAIALHRTGRSPARMKALVARARADMAEGSPALIDLENELQR